MELRPDFWLLLEVAAMELRPGFWLLLEVTAMELRPGFWLLLEVAAMELQPDFWLLLEGALLTRLLWFLSPSATKLPISRLTENPQHQKRKGQ